MKVVKITLVMIVALLGLGLSAHAQRVRKSAMIPPPPPEIIETGKISAG